MPFNQTFGDFYKRAKEVDFIRDVNFRVTALNLGTKAQPFIEEGELVYATGAAIPGRKINNVAVPFMGTNLNADGTVEYSGSDSFKITFRVDAKGNFRNKLEFLQRQIYNDQTSTGAYFTARDDSVMNLTLLTKGFDALTTYQLVGVSLKSIGAMEFKYAEGKGDIVTVDTEWSYHFYTILPIAG